MSKLDKLDTFLYMYNTYPMLKDMRVGLQGQMVECSDASLKVLSLDLSLDLVPSFDNYLTLWESKGSWA